MDPAAERGKSGRNVSPRGMFACGILLLAAGIVLFFPYFHSRIVNPASSSSESLAVLPSPFPIASPTPTLTPSMVHAITSTLTVSLIPPSPTSPPLTPTATPAIPTRITISRINVDAPIVPVSWYTTEIAGQVQATWEVPDQYAAGWHETSAPLGQMGNTVLNGHNTTYGEVFRDLYKLEAGDPIIVYAGDVPYTYTVSEVLILPEAGQPLEVRRQNARYIQPTGDERLTLVTCHPYGSLRYRLVLIAHPVRRLSVKGGY